MPTPHISAEQGQVAPLVLMPGDPKRAARIAAEHLDGAELVSDVRGIGCEHVHPDRRREQEDRLHAHARHYSTPSRFTAR